MFYPEDYALDDTEHKFPLFLISKYRVKDKSKATYRLISNIICLIISSHSKYWFNQINRIILAEDNSTGDLFSLSKRIGRQCFYQMLCGNNTLFGNVYGMEKSPLLWFDISTLPDKYSHGVYSNYEVAFGTIPGIVPFFTTYYGTISNIMVQIRKAPVPNSNWVLVQSPIVVISNEIFHE